ncbi:VanZ family protein [Dyadobacter tibetensis]|uniref:VanZ family protein n=1 Tax=Dyadobacter tibetensis TaxID=1211851 RepID=UPI00046F241D|nr:VanZ family protein [Dyadobacter tibetensis]
MKHLLALFLHKPAMAWLWTIFITVICNWPAQNIPQSSFPGTDKIIHIGFFLIWTILWLIARGIPAKHIIWIGTLFGLAIEITQWILPFNRSFDWLDLLADSTGIILGILIYRKIMYHYLQRLY